MPTLESAISAERKTGFWLAALFMLFLAGVSWQSNQVTAYFNTHVFQQNQTSVAGWWLYVGFRVVLTVLVVWMIARFPNPKRTSQNTAKIAKSEAHFFDPLMGLRALACMLVLIGHYFLVVFSFSPGGIPNYVQMLLLSSPWSGVWIFFALSGFLMAKGFASGRYTLDETGYRMFLRNRMLRIVPVYYSGILIVSIYRYTEILHLNNWWMLLEMLVFDYRGDLPINPIGALWSVSTEVQFYALVPFLMVPLLHLRKRFGLGFFLLPIVALSAGTLFRRWIRLHFGQENMGAYGYAPMISNLDIFISGMSLTLMPKIKTVSTAVRGSLGPILFFGSAIFYAYLCYITFYRERWHMNLSGFLARGPILVVPFALGLIYLSEIRGNIQIKSGWTGQFLIALKAIGTLTYCLYVFHSEVFIVNRELLPKVHSLKLSLINFPIVMLETVAVASFFYFAVEKPFDTKKRVIGTALLDAP